MKAIMKKKGYFSPKMQILAVGPHTMLAASGNFTVSDTEKTSGWADSRSNGNWDIWGEEDCN